MKFSFNFLKQWCTFEQNPQSLCEVLTSLGFEVDKCEYINFEYDKVIVGRVVSVKKHPQADRLSLCQVQIAEVNAQDNTVDNAKNSKPSVVQIVCGASDIQVGMCYPIALPGAKLPAGKITKAKLRGELSNGMICSASELNLGPDSSDIMRLGYDSQIGIPLSDVTGKEDWLIEIDITTNRGDVASYLGVAREICAFNKSKVHIPRIDASKCKPQEQSTFTVNIQAPDLCPNYCVQQIHLEQQQPLSSYYISEMLRRSDIRCHSLLVDTTNLILLELGQPLHAFDADKLSENIVVRLANPAESLELLDGTQAKLSPNDLVISDSKHSLALAGIMGGKTTAVTIESSNILLESALFIPTTIAGKARDFQVTSNAAYHFERGVDPRLQLFALQRGTAVILSNVQGYCCEPISFQSESFQNNSVVTITVDHINQRIGSNLTQQHICEMLQALGFEVSSDVDGLSVKPSSWRYDINLPEDIIEEVARLVGFDALGMGKALTGKGVGMEPQFRHSSVLRAKLLALNLLEHYSYAMTGANQINALFGSVAGDLDEHSTLLNPFNSDESILSPSLLPNALKTFIHNVQRQQNNLRYYELAKCFPRLEKASELIEQQHLVMVIAGDAEPHDVFADKKRPVDFFDMKGLVNILYPSLPIEYVPLNKLQSEQINTTLQIPHVLNPNNGAALILDNNLIGYIGSLDRSKIKLPKTPQSVVCELNIDYLRTAIDKVVPVYKLYSRLPSIQHDLSFIVPAGISAEKIIQITQQYGQVEVKQVSFSCEIFDFFQTKDKENIVGIRLIWTPMDGNLREDEILVARQNILTQLQQQLSVGLRDH